MTGVQTCALPISGNISYTDVETLIAQNSLIFLANNNITSDVVDIGFVGQANNGTEIIYTGLFRHAGEAGKDYYLFDDYTVNPDGSFTIDPSSNGFTVANLHANLISTKVESNVFLAAEGLPDGTANAGYTFGGEEGGADTGMFSDRDGRLSLYTNNQEYLRIDQQHGYINTYAPIILQEGTLVVDNNYGSLAIGAGAGISDYSSSVAIGSNEIGRAHV